MESTNSTAESVSLVDAALVFRLGYHAMLNRVLRGEVRGWRDERNRWRVDCRDLSRARVATSHRAVKGKGRVSINQVSAEPQETV
jgi:hypothetical protein